MAFTHSHSGCLKLTVQQVLQLIENLSFASYMLHLCSNQLPSTPSSAPRNLMFTVQVLATGSLSPFQRPCWRELCNQLSLSCGSPETLPHILPQQTPGVHTSGRAATSCYCHRPLYHPHASSRSSPNCKEHISGSPSRLREISLTTLEAKEVIHIPIPWHKEGQVQIHNALYLSSITSLHKSSLLFLLPRPFCIFRVKKVWNWLLIIFSMKLTYVKPALEFLIH